MTSFCQEKLARPDDISLNTLNKRKLNNPDAAVFVLFTFPREYYKMR
jgi:hypothetical protein